VEHAVRTSFAAFFAVGALAAHGLLADAQREGRDFAAGWTNWAAAGGAAVLDVAPVPVCVTDANGSPVSGVHRPKSCSAPPNASTS